MKYPLLQIEEQNKILHIIYTCKRVSDTKNISDIIDEYELNNIKDINFIIGARNFLSDKTFELYKNNKNA